MTAQPPAAYDSIDGLRTALAEHRAGQRIALVPTMGALHAGHLSLVRHAAQLADVVIVSIFVNPLQFAPGEDLERYPRSLRADLAALTGEAELVFAPSVDQMYPHGTSATRIHAGPVGALYEGVTRPTHFDGMLTVVAKLVNIVQPDFTLFGQKDAQQTFLVRQMVRDLNVPTEIEVVPTVREPSGLALSSRNQYLDAPQRAAAGVLSAALADASACARNGAAAALAAARARLQAEPAVRLDYLVIVDPATFMPVEEEYHGAATMLVAARVGTTHLIDNTQLVIE